MTKDPAALALDWAQAGRKIALATVIETWGSAPRPVGSQLVIDADGAMEGSVSGGCVEGAVVLAAMDAITAGGHTILDFGISDDAAFAVGLACGGQIKVLVQPLGDGLTLATLQALADARAAARPIGLATDLATGSSRIITAADAPACFRLDRSGMQEDGSFITIQNPPLRMIIVGAVHIAQPLVGMARACGYAPVLIDPRGAFGSAARFPGETIIEDWPDAALAALKPDARTAIVTLTHDPKLDDPAIMTALRSDVFYLGCLGSTRTHAKRVARLQAAGFNDADIARIHAPVGLDIGGRHPAEIAVSIMAQVTQTLRRRA
ncbi:XdhC family protein [Yoonia vestfoldensis]|jgi:xanthine dehydrogenase accessory factor|uniref:Putative xanthine dehydrogenase subunit A n=1 Tax=Yoonia vestfoldensis TaxID=245188 RepID=A0A1Y0EA35_9RHOB|nr:XdhC family protein [Yoonia vestfoldensis]ARU00484.1 putative xanthine dehydrogenase subunit A [Yoonia vestfoldensis]